MLATAGVLLSACDTGDGTTLRPPDTIVAGTCAAEAGIFADAEGIFALRSPDFEIDGPIPARYGATVGTEGRWPELLWREVPEGAAELAVVLTDDATGEAHWVVGGIDPAAGCIPAGQLPEGAAAYTNSFGEQGYTPPDLAPGEPQRFYVFQLHALSEPLGDVPPGVGVTALLDTLDAQTIETTLLVGTSPDPEAESDS